MITEPQRKLLRVIDQWGELSPDTEHEIGCHGAALNRVLDAVFAKGLVRWIPHGGMSLTDKGRDALNA